MMVPSIRIRATYRRRRSVGAGLRILRLARSVSAGRLDAAASRAIEIGALTYGSVKSILDNKLDRLAADPLQPGHQPLRHRNIRGGGYFH